MQWNLNMTLSWIDLPRRSTSVIHGDSLGMSSTVDPTSVLLWKCLLMFWTPTCRHGRRGWAHTYFPEHGNTFVVWIEPYCNIIGGDVVDQFRKGDCVRSCGIREWVTQAKSSLRRIHFPFTFYAFSSVEWLRPHDMDSVAPAVLWR